jgi:hypothetical protein
VISGSILCTIPVLLSYTARDIHVVVSLTMGAGVLYVWFARWRHRTQRLGPICAKYRVKGWPEYESLGIRPTPAEAST